MAHGLGSKKILPTLTTKFLLLTLKPPRPKNICRACFLLPTQALLLFSDAALYHSLIALPTTTISSASILHSLKSTHLYIDHTAKLRSWQRSSQALIFLNPPLVGCACKPSKATMAVMYPATLIPPPKTWSPWSRASSPITCRVTLLLIRVRSSQVFSNTSRSSFCLSSPPTHRRGAIVGWTLEYTTREFEPGWGHIG